MKHHTFEEFKAYISTLSYGHLHPLFRLLPELNTFITSKNASTYSYENTPKIIRQVNNEILRLELIPVFNWSVWQEGMDLLQHPNTNYNNLPFYDLCKLLTVIYRADRFNEGYKLAQFTNGTVYKILKAMETNFNAKQF